VPTHVLSMKGGGPKIDGLLPTSIFNRIYISNSGGFAMFEPKQPKSSALSGTIASLPPQGTGAHGGGY